MRRRTGVANWLPSVGPRVKWQRRGSSRHRPKNVSTWPCGRHGNCSASIKCENWIPFFDYFFWPTHPLIRQKHDILKNRKLWTAPNREQTHNITGSPVGLSRVNGDQRCSRGNAIMRNFQHGLTRTILNWMSYKLVIMIAYGSLVNVPNLVRIGSKMASPGRDEVSWNQGLACLFMFFFVSRDRVLVKRVDRFSPKMAQKTRNGVHMCLLGFRKINFIVFTPKIPKNPYFWALSMHFLWKTKMLITFEP